MLHYTEFEREHARLEEREILPRAEAALQPEDWQVIDAAFGEHEDPMFGGQWQTEFSRLFEKLVNTLPAPYGLGEVWK